MFQLHHALYERRQAADTLVPVAVVACVLARVAADNPARSLAAVLGPPYGSRDGEPPPLLSPLRLKRLTAARDPTTCCARCAAPSISPATVRSTWPASA